MSDNLIRGPVKLKVRGDRPAGVVRAWFALMDESEQMEVGTLSIALADRDKQAYEDWVQAMSDAVKRWVQSVSGIEVAAMIRETPNAESN